MKTVTVLLCIVVVLQFSALFVQETGAFSKVSYPTAFAIITAAVKFKALWVKAYLGLRQMGKYISWLKLGSTCSDIHVIL